MTSILFYRITYIYIYSRICFRTSSISLKFQEPSRFLKPPPFPKFLELPPFLESPKPPQFPKSLEPPESLPFPKSPKPFLELSKQN